MKVTKEHALDYRASRKASYAYVRDVLGIHDPIEQRRTAEALTSLVTELEHPEFEVLAGQMRAKGFTVKLKYLDETVYVYVMNDPERRSVSEWGGYGVGLEGQYLGTIRASFYRKATFEYEGWASEWSKRNHGRKHKTGKWSKLLKRFALEARMPTQADYDQLVAARTNSKAKQAVVDRRYDLEKLIAKHGARVFEILATANVAIPEDFKAVMSEYLDLTGE